MIRHVALRIDEIYLDSFLYSGALLLLGTDGVLTSYDWHRIVASTLQAHNRAGLASLFLDSRQAMTIAQADDRLELEISGSVLRDCVTSAISRDVWPTDINIYANNIYISDESGVDIAPFDYVSKAIAGDRLRAIKRGYVYSVAPGDGGRLAIASADDGLSVLVLDGHERQLVEDDVFDCDWFGTKLVANSRHHSYLTRFAPLPKKESFADVRDYFASARHARDAEPTTAKLDAVGPSDYRWLAGEEVIEELPGDVTGDPISSRVIKARSASFGSIIEHVDRVVVQRSDRRDTLDIQKPIFWRTFSRSRNYLNHLHACDSHGMQFRAYDTADREGDRFAVELSDFET